MALVACLVSMAPACAAPPCLAAPPGEAAQALPAEPAPAQPAQPALDCLAKTLAGRVTIYRDAYGVPHVDGADDAATVFGFAYAQAEDYFWQVEDTYILCLGRYSEVYGPRGLNSDLLNRAFEIVPRSRADYPDLEPELQRLCEAFVAGLNFYLATHPEVTPRLIDRFEPWHMLAYVRHLTVEMTFRYTRLSNSYLPRMNPIVAAATGSNAWAVAPQRTASGNAMLFVNPHQPWFGFGQMYEAHLRSGEGWNFSGATFFGSPLPTLGHNEHCGWAFTVNEPDVADVWRETFDHPENRLAYRYAGAWRTAVEWQESVRVKTGDAMQERRYTFCKTHHGPIVQNESDVHRLSARIARLYESMRLGQAAQLMRCKNVDDFKQAMGLLNFPIMNAVYADKQGTIYYLYNGAVPRRDPRFDWTKPVDGGDPRTEWQGCHALAELPQVLNPPAGFVQNCNSTPFTTSDDGNPVEADFPPYMVEDKADDKRRAKMSRQILRQMSGVTFEDLERLAFDTTLYWAQHELPRYEDALVELKTTHPDLARQVEPYLEHLLDWDCRCELDSTQAPLCVAWYEELYGTSYPGETLLSKFVEDVPARFEALLAAANRLQATHGDWQVPWGDVYRIQRHANVADLLDIPFDDALPSLPCAGTYGPMGVVFTQYYTPSIYIPFFKTVRRRYGVVGYTYTGVYEFGERIRGASLVHFGASGGPDSPNYLDQGKLLSERKLKPELFYWEDVQAQAISKYRPGERGASAP